MQKIQLLTKTHDVKAVYYPSLNKHSLLGPTDLDHHQSLFVHPSKRRQMLECPSPPVDSI